MRVHSKSGKYIAILPETMQGSFDVCVTRDGVSSMRSSWPCSRLPDRAIRFAFAGNGDLVDISTGYDGEDILALSHDAQEFGERVMEKRRKDKAQAELNQRDLGSGI